MYRYIGNFNVCKIVVILKQCTGENSATAECILSKTNEVLESWKEEFNNDTSLK